MPLEIIAIMVIGGIVGIALLLHFTGHSQPFAITDAETARREWLSHRPDDRIRALHLSGGAALVLTEAGPGLLRPFGADTIAHRITYMTKAPRGLRIGFGDVAAPDVTLAMPDSDAADWLKIWEDRHA